MFSFKVLLSDWLEGLDEWNRDQDTGDIITGKVNGNIRANELLQLRGECMVAGNIYAGKLQVEPTATFNGQCHMGANVVEMNKDEQQAQANVR